MRIPYAKSHHSVRASGFGGVCAMGIMCCALPVGATEPAAPWECSTFVGEAQDRCIRTFVELQQEKIVKLEKDLEVQQQAVLQLQQQVSQPASATGDLERQLTHKPSLWYGPPSVHVYPPLGLSLRFGQNRFWGGSLFYGRPPYFSPQWYGHGHRRWHRH